MYEIALAKLVEEFTSKVTEDLYEYIGELKDDVKYFIDNGVKQYLNDKGQKFSKTKTLLHRAYPVNLYDVYQPMELSPKERMNRNTKLATDDVSNVFKKSNSIIVEGTAGSGKSTLMKHFFIDSIRLGNSIPILITLRYLNDYDGSFFDYIKDQLLYDNVSPDERILEKVLNKGKFTFLLDGYDELKSENRSKIIKNLVNFMDKYDVNKFVLTSRPYSNIDLLPKFYIYLISPLSAESIYSFISKQITNIELQGKIISSIKSSNKKFVKEFLSNPLLLSLYILAFNNNSVIPDKKYIFYRRVIDTLFAEHDSVSKFGYEREKMTGLSQEHIEDVLQRFSFITYFEGQFDFEKDYLVAVLSKVNDNLPSIDFDVRSLISDMKVATSLWIEDSGIVSFAHRSIQEYFCSLFINNLPDHEKESVFKILIERVKHKNLQEYNNFFELCIEINKLSYYKYFTIPLLSEVERFYIDTDDNSIKLNKILSSLFESPQFRIFKGDHSTERALREGYRDGKVDFGLAATGVMQFLEGLNQTIRDGSRDLQTSLRGSSKLHRYLKSNKYSFSQTTGPEEESYDYYEIFHDQYTNDFESKSLEDEKIKNALLNFIFVMEEEIIMQKKYIDRVDVSNNNLLDFIK